MRPSQTWIVGAIWLVGLVGGAPAARACEGTTEQIVGYSWQRDEYVTEERPLKGTGPSRFVTRALSTGEVADYATCSGAGPCSAPEALGMKACSLRPVPRSAPVDLSLQQVEDDPAGADVRSTGSTGAMPIIRVRRAGRLRLRSAVRTDASMILFLADTVDDHGCARTHERAVVAPLRQSDGAAPAVDLSVHAPASAAPGIALRVASPLSPSRLEALTMAARSAAAAHLDALAACWAQQALSIIAANQARAQRARRRPAAPSIQVEDVRIILVRSQPPGTP